MDLIQIQIFPGFGYGFGRSNNRMIRIWHKLKYLKDLDMIDQIVGRSRFDRKSKYLSSSTVLPPLTLTWIAIILSIFPTKFRSFFCENHAFLTSLDRCLIPCFGLFPNVQLIFSGVFIFQILIALGHFPFPDPHTFQPLGSLLFRIPLSMVLRILRVF